MPLIVGAVAAVGSAVGGAIEGGEAAGAQKNIAAAQAQAAEQARQQAMKSAAPTAQELAGISDRISQQAKYQAVQDASVQRDEAVLNSIDPSLVEAGKQANQLMQGQAASILAPMKQQQAMQRNQLQQQLAAQLGPGYATSTAGQAALQQFDMSSNMQLQGAQMSALQGVTQYLGYGSSAASSVANSERLGFETGSQISAQTLGIMGNIQQRQTNATLGTQNQAIGTAGSQFAGQQSGVASTVSTIGGGIAGLMSGLGGSPAPTSTGPQSMASLGTSGGGSANLSRPSAF